MHDLVSFIISFWFLLSLKSLLVIFFFRIHIYFSLDTDEELNEWKSKFDERIATLESKISKLSREKTDIEDESHAHEDVIAKNVKEIATLQAAIEVVFVSLSAI